MDTDQTASAIDACCRGIDECLRLLNDPDVTMDSRLMRFDILEAEINRLEQLKPDHPAIVAGRTALALLR